MPQSEARLVRAHDNFVEAYRLLARALPGGDIVARDGAEFVFTGRPDVEFNRLFLYHAPADCRGLLTWAEARARARHAGYMLVATPQAAAACAEAAREHGLEPGRPAQLMLLDDPAGITPRGSLAGLEIERVTSSALADTFVSVVGDGFGAPREFYRSFAAAGVWDSASVASYIGWLGSEPVASASTVTSGCTVGLYQVATIPGFRRKGLGDALARHALEAAAAQGAEEAALQSTSMGFRIYRRVGFESAFSYRTWYSAARR